MAIDINIGSRLDSKGFKQAETAVSKLNKGAKNLARNFGLAFGTAAVIAYGKASVKAFAEDDKAARTLSKTLSNLGLAFADPEVKTFISSLEKQAGVLDDFLRPAYQKLVTTTGDYRRSQDLLKTAIDLSAQSGVDLLTVSEDIGKAFIGNTRGLVKYNLGLNKTQLAAMSFEEVLLRITKISQGQAAIAADTYAGKLNKLTVAGANAQEVLGGALLDAVIKLGGGDIDKTTDKIDKLSTSLASLIRLTTGTSDMSLKDILQGVDYKFGFIPVNKVKAPRSKSPAGTFMRNQAEIKAAANAKKLAADQAKSQKALTKAQQDALKLAKAKAIFDLQKIQIEAALKGKISEEDAIRLKLMKAIEEENLTNIEKYQKALTVAQEKTKELNTLLTTVKLMEIKDPFGLWKIDPITASINELTKSMLAVQTQIQANGKEWSSFSATVGATTLKPNLTEWTSSFGAAGSAATAAAQAALAAQQAALAAQSKAAQEALAAGSAAAQAAAAAQLKAAQEAAAAQSAAIAGASAEQKAALEAQLAAQQAALAAQNAAALAALKIRLAEEAAAYAELAAATQAAAEAQSILGSNDSATRNAAILAAQAAAAQAAAAAALAAAEQAAANNATTTTGASKIEITVNTGIGDPNAIAEAIAQVITGANQRGTLDVLGFE
jgi:hypothetical protein